ncbi:MAG: alpha/beta hydrolase [Clostridia bacterium]|nr:alpha/beta hydrolase [Clostridia bacterium]
MKRFVHFVLILSTICSGIAAQIDFVFQPAKYNAITLDTSNLPTPVTEPRVDTFVQLEDVKMHYQVYGEIKPPLILIHGNGGSVKSLREAAQYLANDFTVYLPESRCHGQSSDPGVITYELMAKDFMQFIEAMGLKKPVIMGHSDGAINAIQLAADYPDVPGAIIACGANSNPDTFKPYFPFGVWVKNIFEKDKLNDLMLTLPDFTEEYLAQITCPTYVVSGQYDIMWLTDTVYLYEAIKGSDMAVIRRADHSSYMSQDGKWAYVLATDWLKAKDLL